MKILITGGNGYIASTLLKELTGLHQVTSITRQIFDLTNSTVTSAWFKDKEFDVVIHTAIDGGSRLRNDTFSTLDNNLRMYYNLLDNHQSFKRFISIGSGAELFQQHTPYGMSKHVIRHSILEKDNFYNVRVFAVFDEHELDTRFIKANVRRYINKEPMSIHKDKRMDFFYMKDFVNVIKYYISDNKPPKEFDCSYQQHLYLSEIVEFINTLSHYKVNVVFDNQGYTLPYTGMFTNLNLPFIGLHQGIQHVYNTLLCKI